VCFEAIRWFMEVFMVFLSENYFKKIEFSTKKYPLFL